MLEQCKTTTSEVVDQIKRGVKLCTKMIEAVLMTWELFLEDDTVAKFTEEVQQAELKIETIKESMRSCCLNRMFPR